MSEENEGFDLIVRPVKESTKPLAVVSGSVSMRDTALTAKLMGLDFKIIAGDGVYYRVSNGDELKWNPDDLSAQAFDLMVAQDIELETNPALHSVEAWITIDTDSLERRFERRCVSWKLHGDLTAHELRQPEIKVFAVRRAIFRVAVLKAEKLFGHLPEFNPENFK
jgi:hypothetical protein